MSNSLEGPFPHRYAPRERTAWNSRWSGTIRTGESSSKCLRFVAPPVSPFSIPPVRHAVLSSSPRGESGAGAGEQRRRPARAHVQHQGQDRRHDGPARPALHLLLRLRSRVLRRLRWPAHGGPRAPGSLHRSQTGACRQVPVGSVCV